MYQNKNEMKHVMSIYASIDSNIDAKAESFSACEKPCVCHCVCKHGGSNALDFSNKSELEMTKTLYQEFLCETH